MSSIHGHQVMELLLEHPEGLTRGQLSTAIADRFGSDARFHTCSREGMTIGELIDFLEQRGKFDDRAGKLSTEPERICSH